MIGQATKGILTIIVVLILTPYTSLAKDKSESSTITVVSPSIPHDSYDTQEDLLYIYSLNDEGLMDAKEIYHFDNSIDDYEQSRKYRYLSDYDAIDFELYTKGQEVNNRY